MIANTPKTLFEKIWDQHVVHHDPATQTMLYIDLHLVHEVTSPQAFEGLRVAGRQVRRPELTVATQDHNVPTVDRHLPIKDIISRKQIETLRQNCSDFGVRLYDLDSPQQGIVHVIGPELGLTQPGMTIVCGDSHTSTHGAFGALAFGIGTSEVEHVLATQTLLQTKPKTFEARFDNQLASGVEYIRGRENAPADFEAAVARWKNLPTDEGASYDRVEIFDAAKIAPQVTWGTNPGQVIGVDAKVPNPADFDDAADQQSAQLAIEYMKLKPGRPIEDIEIDRVFIGSCTNSRIEDLREAATFVDGKKVSDRVDAMVVPGSGQVKQQAESEGLDKIFKAAGFDWREAGCSMCLAMNPDKLEPGQRCASTSNRNFEGRQGRGGLTGRSAASLIFRPRSVRTTRMLKRWHREHQINGRGALKKPA